MKSEEKEAIQLDKMELVDISVTKRHMTRHETLVLARFVCVVVNIVLVCVGCKPGWASRLAGGIHRIRFLQRASTIKQSHPLCSFSNVYSITQSLCLYSITQSTNNINQLVNSVQT